MRIAFHAPLKPADHPVPSGDRQIARLLIAALRAAGHEVEIASRLRTREAAGDPHRQQELLGEARREVDRLLHRYAAAPPDLWFTYHLYYKAPDLIGPEVSEALNIPYVVVEASHAAKRLTGLWSDFASRAQAAIASADCVIALNRSDMAALAGIVPAERMHHLPPFMSGRARPATGFRPRQPLRLLAIGMMRGGDKLASFRALALALRRSGHADWTLTIVGDGPEARQVHTAFQPIRNRVRWTGAVPPSHLARVIGQHDLMVWPAVNEAFGMGLVEASCHGLPAIAGRTGGVPDVVIDGRTGVLVPPQDQHAMSRAITGLIRHPRTRLKLGNAAWHRASRIHAFAGAVRQLDTIISSTGNISSIVDISSMGDMPCGS